MRSAEKRCFGHPSPPVRRPSGEDNILKLVWEAKKKEAAQEIDIICK